MDKGNDVVIDAIQAHPDRFFGYITVNAHDPSQVQSECECCWSGGCRGLKLHSDQGINYDRHELRPALEFADTKRCPVLFAEVSPKVKQKILSDNARTVFFGSPASGGSTR